jgi:hypothetical protein
MHVGNAFRWARSKGAEANFAAIGVGVGMRL